MYQYRQILTRMRQGDSDREIARSKTMGRKKIAQVREVASARGWLAPDTALPDDAVLASALMRKEPLPRSCADQHLVAEHGADHGRACRTKPPTEKGRKAAPL